MALFNRADTNAAAADRLARLEQLRSQVTHGLRNFVAAGEALAEIREKELYRCTHETFEKFCQATWNMTRQHAAQLIDAAVIARNLSTMVSQPTSERQVRPLKPLTPEQQRDAWKEATADGPPTTSRVQKAVTSRLPSKRRKKPKPIRVRVPLGLVIVERKRSDVDPIALLQHAIDKLRSEVTKAA
jgi:hypothetical protein